jgi:hypothetical protein
MTRVSGEQIVLRPSNNVYTALAVIGVLAQVIGIAALFLKASEVGGLL